MPVEALPLEPQTCHILAVDLIDGEHTTSGDLRRAFAILSELLVSCDVYERANAAGKLVTYPEGSSLLVLFLDDKSSPVQCAFELWELLKELPSMRVRMGVHSGPVGVDGARAVGSGVDEVRTLATSGRNGQILLTESYVKSLEAGEPWLSQIEDEGGCFKIEPQKLLLLDPGREGQVLAVLETALVQDGHEVMSDSDSGKGVGWAKSLEARIRSADTVVAVVSGDAADDEVLQYQLEVAVDERRKRGRPHILPVWLHDGPMPEGPLAVLHRNLRHAAWQGSEDNDRMVAEVRSALEQGQEEIDANRIDATGGAVAGDSRFYVVRPADREFEEAIRARVSIILIKGPRQIGKTSLIGRGIEYVRQRGWRSASTDFQQLSSRQLESDADFYRVVATTLCLQMDFEYDFESRWMDVLGSNLNMDLFLRALLAESDGPLVWFIDEADRLFSSPFGSDFFALIRSWHNARATDGKGRWSKLTVVIGYATEAHLFIKDLNQSPFNVGLAVPMTMFTLQDTIELNERYGRPFQSDADLRSLFDLVAGQPFLTRRALEIVARRKMDAATLLASADHDDGPFGDHLKRMLFSVTQLPFVWEALLLSLNSLDLQNSEGLQRLVAAGVLVRKPDKSFALSCELYRRYLSHYVHG